MKITNYLKEKSIQITLIIFALITIEIFLQAYPTSKFLKIYIPTIILSTYLITTIIEYTNKNKYYKKIYQTLNQLEEKYLITEIINEADFEEGRILKEILEQINKSMHENVNKYKYIQEDYKEYIEIWIHEIKTPLATSKMIIENNKNETTKSINEEINKIENYIEQALYYARSNTVSKDYYIKQTNIKDIVNETIKKNKTTLIEQKISINIHDIEKDVKTDSKWITFILNQIIQNSIKYKKQQQPQIEIYTKQRKENITLYIKDNGIGIKKNELARVFEKGFTGTNGRTTNKKSTGIGLYLCKKLCKKLGIAIKLDSIENKGTEIQLIFPNSSYIQMQ